MISAESQLLERHLVLFENKKLLLTGGINDGFAQQLKASGFSLDIWSWYFDYVQNQQQACFTLDYERQAELIIFYWIKNKQEANFQLMQLLAKAPLQQELLIVGENRSGVRSVEKLLTPFGEIVKIDSARRCGLYHFSLTKKPEFKLEQYWKSYQHPQLNGLKIFSLPGVFSANELDAGSALLLSTFEPDMTGDILDLGCGAGVLGCYLKKQSPHVQLSMSDIYLPSLLSAERNLQENQLSAQVIASDVFSHIDGKFDLIISNPPFHDGIDTAYRAVTELIQQAKWYLKTGGELRIVANAFLPYADILDQYFGGHQVLARTSKFKVYSAKLS